ncbi:FlaD/FlaE family flagellar protein [Haladaptatus cibarius]|uniref:FlaD/FlaE family flagellar protein n=1 Tax=Haladaptatus cibarius TaxID=453847 RepID=UPI001E5592BB|nr:FlaD/FlaE family flagellar protein [Haladaptatus cibarius]
MKLITLAPDLVPIIASGSLAMGAMGIMDFMEDDENSDEGADGDDLFDDDLGGDDLGGDDFGGMDGGMDDWGGGGDDGFGDMGGGGAATQELENRLDDLENEVGDIASTVSTVRSENEQISEKVDDVEENVRKLLEIYEMVTRGVNPFVDDVPNGGMGGDAFGGGDGAGSFGLFDEEEEEEADSEDLDDDVADADAESFFDESFDDIEDEDELDEFEDDEKGDMDGETDESDDGGQAGGSTFQELKEEYESGEADWADEAAADEGEPEPELEMDMEPEIEPESEMEPEPEPEMDDGDFEFQEPEQTTESQAAETTMQMRNGMEKPYLAVLPSGYIVDLVVLEWLEFLVEEFGPEDTIRTIAYYEDIEWISEPVKEDLLSFVGGIADVSDVDSEATPATLGVHDHVRSLSFMSQLSGDAIEQKVVDHCAQIRGEGNGLQR